MPEPISCIAAAISIATTAVKVLKQIHDFHEDCNDIRLSVSSLRSQLVLAQMTLVQIDELVKVKIEGDNITRPVLKALEVGVTACNEILHDIDRFANEEAVKSVKGKVEHMWNRSTAQSKKQELQIQIQSLSALINVLQAQSIQEQRGQLGRFFGTLRRAKNAAANINRVDSVLDGDGNDDPPAYSPMPISPSEWMPKAKPPTPAPKPTRKWSSIVLLSPDAKRQLSRDLIDAAANGDLKLVDELWSKGGDVNYQSQSEIAKKSRMTAVHAAVWEGHLHVLEGLVDRGAKLDKVMDGGLTALHVAACQDYPEIVKFLLEHGIDANAKDDLGETALFGVSEQMTRLLLDAKANVDIRDNEQATALHKASYIGYASVVKDLIASGAEVEAQDKFGKTALHYACDCSEEVYIQERVALVDCLLKAGASPNTPARETSRTPLHQAVQSGHLEIVDLLLSKDVNATARDTNGYTAAHFAAELNNSAILESLIKAGADIQAQTTHKKYTPLHCAAMKGQKDCTAVLIKATSNIEARCSKSFTPLHYASEGSCPETVKALLAANANPYAKDVNNQTPLHCVRESADAVEMLLGAMASIDARDARDATPLHTVVQHGSLKAVEALLDHEAPLEAINSKKQTPLEALCSNETLWIIPKVDSQTDAKDMTTKEDNKDVEVPEKWETDIQEPWEIRLDIVKLLLERNAKVSKDCVKAVVGWEADQPKATVLAALCLKTTGMTRLMILTNRAVIGSGVLSLIKDMEAALEKKAAEKREAKEAKELEKVSKKGSFGKKKDDAKNKGKDEEKKKGKQDTDAGKKDKKGKSH